MKPIVKKILLSLLAGVLTFILSFFGLLNTLDYMLTDAFYQRPGVVDNRIKIIAIDEKSLSDLGAYGTWDRSLYASLLDKLYESPEYTPSLVIFDVIFQGETKKEADAALASAAQRAGGVVAASNLVFKTAIETDSNGNKYINNFKVDMIEYPYDGLLENSIVGYADSIQDVRDKSVRSFFPVIDTGSGLMNSLSVAALGKLKETGEWQINIPDTLPGETLILNYQGSPGAYEHLSFSDVLAGNIPAQAFKNTVVFVGAYAPGMMDSFDVPTGKGSQMYGVEIHANILDAVNKGAYMVGAGKITYSLTYSVVAAIFAFLAQLLPLFAGGLLGLALMAAQIILGLRLSGNHIFLPLISLPVALVLIFLINLGGKYFASLLQKRKVLKAFSQYVAPQVVAEIAKKGDFNPKIGGEKRHIAVLFVDIRGFTPLSEALEPEQVVAILNEYLSLTTKAIFDNLGTLDKFVGDATMAVFNSPFDLDDYIYRAVCAARDIVTGSEELRKKAFELTGKEVGFGVGVNCGEAIVGNIGCDFRMDYTAIGDTVNTAARLEANAKAGQVLLSPAVVEALGDRIETTPVGEIPLKGKAKPLMVYELK